MKAVLDSILSRPKSLGILSLKGSYVSYVLGNYDSAVFLSSPEFLRPYQKSYRHALVMCDRVGSGRTESRTEMESDLEMRLAASGWQHRSAAIVIDPELDVWMWQRSSHVESALGWSGRTPGLYDWAVSEGWLEKGECKPRRPKDALNQALRIARIPKSSSIFKQVADKVTLTGCQDPAFQKLRSTLRQWFGSPVP
jgi:hypothetical protein